MLSSRVATNEATEVSGQYTPNFNFVISAGAYTYNRARNYIHSSMTIANDVKKWAKVIQYFNQPRIDSKVGAENMSENHVSLNNIMFEGRIYCLTSPISFYIEKSSKYFMIDYEPLSIYVCEQSREDAIQDFFERFDMLWFNYVEDKETPLSKDAIMLRDKMVYMVKEVKNV